MKNVVLILEVILFVWKDRIFITSIKSKRSNHFAFKMASILEILFDWIRYGTSVYICEFFLS